MISDKQLLDLDAVEGRTTDRFDVQQLGELMADKAKFNEARSWNPPIHIKRKLL